MPVSKCAPLSDDDWPADIADLRDGFAGALNVYRVMARHPALLRAWAPLRQHIVKDNSLGPERSEVVILRTAFRAGSAYEWAHHVSRARALGFTDERIKAVRDMPGGEDGLIVRAVDAFVDHKRLPPETEAGIAAAFGQQAAFDLIALVGFYTILAGVLLTYDTPVDEGIAEEMERRPLPIKPSA